MRFAAALVLLLVTLLIPLPAHAQFKVSLERVAIIGVYSVHTENGTTCKPDAEALTTEAELILRRSGITVDDNRQLSRAASEVLTSAVATEDEKRQARLLYPHSLGINSAAVYLGRRCAVSWSMELYRAEATKLEALVQATYFSIGGVWSGPPNAVTSSILESVRKNTTELANEMLKARQKMSR